MSGRLILNRIEGKAGASNVVTVPTGHSIVGVDTGSVYSPGSVVQFQYAEFSTYSTTTSTSWATLFSVNITPKYSNSLILVRAKMPSFILSASAVEIGGGFRILRNATLIDDSQGDASGPLDFWLNLSGLTGSGYRDIFVPIIKEVADLPSTTSQITYNLQWRVRSGSLKVNYDQSAFFPKSMITAMEIAR